MLKCCLGRVPMGLNSNWMRVVEARPEAGNAPQICPEPQSDARIVMERGNSDT